MTMKMKLLKDLNSNIFVVVETNDDDADDDDDGDVGDVDDYHDDGLWIVLD